MKRLPRLIVATIVLVCMFCTSAFAGFCGEACEITYFDDGSYCISRIVEYSSPASRAANTVAEGERALDYYSASGDILFTLTLYGTFTYDGNIALATSADYDYDIYDTLWSLDNGRAWCTGATALAEATFSHPLLSDVVIDTSLSCSPDGHLF